jgi:hypothetical protein
VLRQAADRSGVSNQKAQLHLSVESVIREIRAADEPTLSTTANFVQHAFRPDSAPVELRAHSTGELALLETSQKALMALTVS